jgi:arylsulfatase A-like enzyme
VPYSAQTHVPLVLRWDRHIRAGGRVGRLAINADVPVTAADAARIEVPDDVTGLSLLGRERHPRIPFSATVGTAYSGNGIRFARPAYCGLRTRRFLYVRYASGHEELYDYRADPHELKNRAGSPRFRGLRRTLRDRTEKDCVPAPPGFRW